MNSTFNTLDIILLPLYLVTIVYFFKARSKKIEDAFLKRIYLISLCFRLIGAILYTLVVLFYYGYGDSLTFYNGSDFITQSILKNNFNLGYLFYNGEDIYKLYNSEVGDIYTSGYFEIESNLFVMKVATCLSAITFNRYILIALFFATFSFVGQWRLFNVFLQYVDKKHTRILAIAVLYSPTIWFWGSGLMKDSLCLGAVGLIVSFIHQFKKHKNNFLKELLIALVASYILYKTKSYILYCIVLALFAYFILSPLIAIKNFVLKIFSITAIAFVFIVLLLATDVGSLIKEQVADTQIALESFQQLYNAGAEEDGNRAVIKMDKEIDLSGFGIIKSAPEAIFRTFFRPFLWDSRSLFMLFSAAECTIFLLLFIKSIYTAIRKKHIDQFVKKWFLFFCLIYCISLGLIIGLTTFNFGTLIRYKVVILPFLYFIVIYLLLYDAKNKEVATQ